MLADASNHSIGINVTAKSTREFSMFSDLVKAKSPAWKNRGVSHNFAIHAGRQCTAAHEQHTVGSRGQVIEQIQVRAKITGSETVFSEVITNVRY